MKTKLDSATTLQMLKGYEIVNRFTDEERRTRLKKITDKESLEIFVSLYQTWKHTGAQAGGDWAKIEQRRIDDLIRFRKAFETLARHKGLI